MGVIRKEQLDELFSGEKKIILPCFLMAALRLPSRQDLKDTWAVNPES